MIQIYIQNYNNLKRVQRKKEFLLKNLFNCSKFNSCGHRHDTGHAE